MQVTRLVLVNIPDRRELAARCRTQVEARMDWQIPTSYGWLNDAILIWLYPIARSSQDHDGHRPELQLASWILVLAAKIC